MSQQMPGPYAIGRNISLFSYMPATASSAGLLTAGSAVSFLGTMKEYNIEDSANLVEIHAAAAGYENYVETSGTFTVNITELMLADGTTASNTQFATGVYIQFEYALTPFGGSAGATKLYTGIMQSRTITGGEGEHTVALVIRPVGIAPTIV